MTTETLNEFINEEEEGETASKHSTHNKNRERQQQLSQSKQKKQINESNKQTHIRDLENNRHSIYCVRVFDHLTSIYNPPRLSMSKSD